LFPCDAWDRASLFLLALVALLVWIGRHDLFPIPPDGYYHLLAAQRISETGAIPLRNYWEFAPAGRPHLYPPLYHIVLATIARFHHGDVLSAFRDVQPFVIPFAHLCVWWLVRWLFGSRRAFLTVLLVGADPLFAIVGSTAPPSVLAGAFAVLMVLCFLSGHTVAAACAGALAFYTHSGILPLALLGLLLFCLWNRSDVKRFIVLAAVAGLLVAPWACWMLLHFDWFKHPIDLGTYGRFSGWRVTLIKLVWLQLLNLGLCLIVFRALRATSWKDPRNRLLLACALGFLPMLFSYGGRYFAHTVHFWAILGAGLLMPLVAKAITKRRVVALAALALCPTVVLVGFGTVVKPGPIPVVSAWCLPPFVAGGGLKMLKSGEALGLFPFEDACEAAEYVRAHTEPDAIVHCPGMNRDFALLVGFTANRPIDKGAWEETMPDEETLSAIQRHARTNPTGCYVTKRPGAIPPDCTIRQFGTVYVGLRTP
jgi:4-amino-4-deoxy-L-arabinose transferase-like glycosyltransferase